MTRDLSTDGEKTRVVKRPRRATGDDSNGYREAIVQAAIKEFADKGLSGARVDAIASRAQANKQLIYYYFGNKVGLYEAALDRMIGRTAEQLDRSGTHNSVADAVQNHLENLLRGGGEEWIRFWLWEALDQATPDEQREEERSGAWGRWVDEFVRAQERGEIHKRFDPKMLALTMNSITVMPYMTPAVTRFITGLEPSGDEFLKRQITLVADFLKSLTP